MKFVAEGLQQRRSQGHLAVFGSLGLPWLRAWFMDFSREPKEAML